MLKFFFPFSFNDIFCVFILFFFYTFKCQYFFTHIKNVEIEEEKKKLGSFYFLKNCYSRFQQSVDKKIFASLDCQMEGTGVMLNK